MSKISYIAALTGTLMLSSSMGASAAIFDFTTANFGLPGSSTVDSATMSVGGLSVSLTAFSIENNGLGAISSMSQLTGGAGVYVSGSSNNVGVRSSSTDGTNIDGGSAGDTTDLDEGILFTFSQAVSLDFINFDSFSNSSDDFNLTVDGINILADHNQLDGTVTGVVSNGIQNDYFDFSVTGTEFLIWADGDSDSFRIDSLNASVVPVPAAAWLFGSGLLGLAGVARRKKHQ